ncbi:hypothetical protein [Brucella pseudogrignonensis]|uniref:hypothetical protein n=1 Tax=Brucella pseudogrignonensis TaxID=419475 RepID=UPI0038D22217
MLPSVPSKTASDGKIETFAAALLDHFSTLRNRNMRDCFRKEMTAKSKFYKTLSNKHESSSNEYVHFRRLAIVFAAILDKAGSEQPPKSRKAKPKTELVYPAFTDQHVMRVHFLASVSLLRDRAYEFAKYCSFQHTQTAEDGSCMVSLGLEADQVWLFERIVVTLGDSGLGFSIYNKSGFEYAGSETDRFGRNSVTQQMQSDNWDARRFSEMYARTAQHLPHSNLDLPVGKPQIPADLPWDPDKQFQNVLNLTQANDLDGALAALDQIDHDKKEPIFDEILYLKYCLRQRISGQDIRYIARKYVRKSSIRSQLEANFDDYLGFVDANVQLREWNRADFPWVQLKDWPEFRQQAYQDLVDYGISKFPRGRIFIWHPDLYTSHVDKFFASDLVDAENAFRLSRRLPEIGKGWISEASLFHLIKSHFPDATFQWTAPWLGRQSIDVYVPSIRTAFEYQGQQHYHAIELFGGEEGLVATQSRDRIKRERLAKNGVRLIEWHYSVPVNEAALTEYMQVIEPNSLT